VLLFLFAVIVISFSEKKQNFCLLRYCSFTTTVLFKIDFLVELGTGLLFAEVKRRSE
jgi:hypothetical protein